MAYVHKDDFNLSGPTHLVGTTIDWNNAHHRRCIMASLVKGVYALKSDRTTKRELLAPPWWNSFHFQLSDELYDPCDGSVFGAIFEFKSPLRKCTKRRLWIRFLYLCSVVVFSLYIFSLIGFKVFLYLSFSLLPTIITELIDVKRILNTPNVSGTRYNINPPRYVIAFRGTSLKPNSMLEDMKLDIQYGLGMLHGSDRIEVAKKAVLDTFSCDTESSVWLAGHSLGAAIALMVGRELILQHKLGFIPETYLFNPPCIHLSSAIWCDSPLLKGAVRFFRSLITGAVAAAVKSFRAEESDFILLSKWIPYIFVHPQDHISSEYIGYFEQRQKMDGIGLGLVERLATQNSLASFFPNAKPAHLLPSAYLTTNLSQFEQFRQAHGLEQWWAPEFFWESKLCDKFWPANFEEPEIGD